MSHVKLGKTSKQRLESVKPELQKVLNRAFETMPFDITVLEGLRTRERQDQLYAMGRTAPGNIVTWTRFSKHLGGAAIDIAPYPINWNDIEGFRIMANHVLRAADELGIPVKWGGSFKTFDGPHFELE